MVIFVQCKLLFCKTLTVCVYFILNFHLTTLKEKVAFVCTLSIKTRKHQIALKQETTILWYIFYISYFTCHTHLLHFTCYTFLLYRTLSYPSYDLGTLETPDLGGLDGSPGIPPVPQGKEVEPKFFALYRLFFMLNLTALPISSYLKYILYSLNKIFKNSLILKLLIGTVCHCYSK